MVIEDETLGQSTEGAILKFTLSLFELQHNALDAVKVASEALGCDKGTIHQRKEGSGSIGVEGWERLGVAGFDLRAYDIWSEAKRTEYRQSAKTVVSPSTVGGSVSGVRFRNKREV